MIDRRGHRARAGAAADDGRGGETTESIIKGPTAQRLETMKPWSTSQRAEPPDASIISCRAAHEQEGGRHHEKRCC